MSGIKILSLLRLCFYLTSKFDRLKHSVRFIEQTEKLICQYFILLIRKSMAFGSFYSESNPFSCVTWNKKKAINSSPKYQPNFQAITIMIIIIIIDFIDLAKL